VFGISLVLLKLLEMLGIPQVAKVLQDLPPVAEYSDPEKLLLCFAVVAESSGISWLLLQQQERSRQGSRLQ
jgi:hypothetical protein